MTYINARGVRFNCQETRLVLLLLFSLIYALCLTNSSGKDDDEVDDDCDDGPNEEEIREVLGTNLSIGEHAFSKMEANADKERMTRSKALAVSPSEEERKAMSVGLCLSLCLVFYPSLVTLSFYEF